MTLWSWGCCLWSSCVHLWLVWSIWTGWWWHWPAHQWCHWWYCWGWFWIGRLHCSSNELPVPSISCSLPGLDLISSMGFLCWCPTDCYFLPYWYSWVKFHPHRLIFLGVLGFVALCGCSALHVSLSVGACSVCLWSAWQTGAVWWVAMLWIIA